MSHRSVHIQPTKKVFKTNSKLIFMLFNESTGSTMAAAMAELMPVYERFATFFTGSGQGFRGILPAQGVGACISAFSSESDQSSRGSAISETSLHGQPKPQDLITSCASECAVQRLKAGGTRCQE